MQTITKEHKNQRQSVMQLSDKWRIASLVWHNENEIEIFKELLDRINISGNSICDVACGTGFHSIMLSNLGFDVVASDVDEGNIEHFQNNIEQYNQSIPIYQADWKNVDKVISKKFDAIFCLGSSITYFESWRKDSKIDLNNRINGLVNVLSNFKNILAKNGKVVIGYSRHYPKNKSFKTINFPTTNDYKMEWRLSFDWERKIKNWECKLKDASRNDLSFELQSHLYSKQEFIKICQKVFNNVKEIDVNEDYYDVFIVCS